mmetsp:Transcript_31012/g.62929  ORF Transcript_31012/g.62929 Transcript_31012/m.62929 type:complete len:352 (+) Transcript_31012:56-1111(+)
MFRLVQVLVVTLVVTLRPISGWITKNPSRPSISLRLVVDSITDAPQTATTAKQALLSLLSGRTDPVLCCPTSLEPLIKTELFLGTPDEKWSCSKFGTVYRRTGPYISLVPSNGASKPFWEKSLQEVVQTDTFRNPFTAFLYERGWRQGFANAGFPGIDAEFELLLDFFSAVVVDENKEAGNFPVMAGTVLDMSCGSGLMSRRLAKEGTLSKLISADFSEAMLLETNRRFEEEKKTAASLAFPELVRCDVACLPLGSGSIDGCHAGAALHCWPQLEEGLGEICRVLKPGGKFFATTFKKGAYGIPRQANSQGGASFRFFDVDELENLLREAGFSEVDVELVGQGCLIARCTK